jgi:hypothetical protein
MATDFGIFSRQQYVFHLYVILLAFIRIMTSHLDPDFASIGLLCWKWAEHGLETSTDRTIFAVLLSTKTIAGLGYLRQGILLPPLMLLSSSAVLVLSQVV